MKKLFDTKTCLNTLVLPLILILSGSANAFVTADYTNASTSESDEDSVYNFNVYDFNVGVLLIENMNTATLGSTFKGYYQTFVHGHQLDTAGVSSPNLNGTGSGSGYELTLSGNFSAKILEVTPFSTSFEITDISSNLNFDTTPDYNFGADTGFSNGEALLVSNISDSIGNGLISTFGFGVLDMTLEFGMSSVNTAVYDPDNISAGSAIFAIDGTSPSLPAISRVAGNAVEQGDLLFAFDGNLQLSEDNFSPVPLPLSAWLFGSAIIGWQTVTRRK